MINRMLIALLLGAFALGGAACSTAQGFGQDVEDTGEYIEDTAEDAAN